MSRIVAQVLALLLVVATAALAWNEWGNLPERIPTHFNALGNPDAWGSRNTFLVLPILSILLYILLTVVERIPHRHNYLYPPSEEHREQIYALSSGMILSLKIVVCGSFLYLIWATARIARGDATRLGGWFLPLFLVLMFAPIIYFYWRSRQIQRGT